MALYGVLGPARNELLWFDQPTQHDREGQQRKESGLVAEFGAGHVVFHFV